MTQLTPTIDSKPTAKTPKVVHVGTKKWAFSFRFWKQIDNFGLDRSDTSWFVSLMEKLSELSKKEIQGFVTSSSDRDAWRYHLVNWQQKNIPIARTDLSWVDKDYLDNADEYPLLQFQISSSLGRVVGFWDENSVFNIVLLDPLHNIQPTKSYGYKVDSCKAVDSPYTTLICQINDIKKSCQCSDPSCSFRNRLNTLDSVHILTNAVIHYMDDMDWSQAQQFMDIGIINDPYEIFKWGIDHLNTELSKS
ncbi:hypothetical protein [Yersinia enterocolitica]